MARTVHCAKLKKDLPGLAYPPVPGELGKRIWANISKEAWDEAHLGEHQQGSVGRMGKASDDDDQ